MISDKNIICFASGWNFHPTSKHHIMRQLAERNNVIWVNWHASRRPSIRPSDLCTMAAKLLQIRRGPRVVSEQMTVLTPLQVPLPGSSLARRITARLVCRAVRKVLDSLPPRPVQVWSFAPDIGDLVGRFNEELAIYYCVDAFGEFPGYDRELILRRERELIDKCGLVLTTSRPLYEAKRRLHPNVHLIEHGVNARHLSRAVWEDIAVPPDLAALPRPVLGFVGVVGEWVDLDLLAGLARSRPDASIVLIGPSVTPLGSLVNLPNVHCLGPKDHSDLPAYLRGFDVGLIPFRDVPLTHHANPIKLYEYLAAGLPVVSTPLPAVRELEGSVWLAADVAGAVAGCAQAIESNTQAARVNRARLMAAESWPARLEQIGKLIAAAIGRAPAVEEIPAYAAPRALVTATVEAQ